MKSTFLLILIFGLFVALPSAFSQSDVLGVMDSITACPCISNRLDKGSGDLIVGPGNTNTGEGGISPAESAD